MLVSLYELIEQVNDPLSIPPMPAVWANMPEPSEPLPDENVSPWWALWAALAIAVPVSWGLVFALLRLDQHFQLSPAVPLVIAASLVCFAVAVGRWR